MFQPDKGHIHHRLLAMGLSSRNVVLILYGVTVALCLMAILIVNLRNETIGLFLVIMGVGALVLVRKTGYLGYLALDKFYGWFRDVTDVAGVSRERRTFLALQIEAGKSRTLEELWAHVGEALEMLKFDRAELHLKNGEERAAPLFPNDENRGLTPIAFNGQEKRRTTGGDSPRRTTQTIFQDIRERGGETVRSWACGYHRRATDSLSDGILKIDLPLDSNGARLLLMKDLRGDPLNYYTLRRLEHLRRTLLSNLTRLQK
jgi:UDP-GlcNAc:undecaprenyl-phosphate GlcNAc-1-phosphate transferase